MTSPNTATADELGRTRAAGAYMDDSRSHAGAVSWAAIIAGAAAAAALSLILLILGTGLGLSSVSPWAHDGLSAAAFGMSTILWLTFTQLVASGMGGYLAGRLRTKWVSIHADEVYFRDTAHGFLAWAIASLATATLLASAIGSIISGGIQAGASVAGGVASTASTALVRGAAAAGSGMAKSGDESGPMNYFVDSLFRKDNSAAAALDTSASASMSNGAQEQKAVPAAEVGRIFMNTLRTGTLPADDLRYVGQLVAQRTGLSPQEAEKRVSDTYTAMQAKVREAENAAREAADKARKASAYASLWLFISLLVGAFVASLAATLGGGHRDD